MNGNGVEEEEIDKILVVKEFYQHVFQGVGESYDEEQMIGNLFTFMKMGPGIHNMP